jgi:threonyl-tRNA synthetase
MATAVTTLWPDAKLGVGPVVENGFYYDIDIPNVTISTDDFAKIEDQMRKVIAENQTFEKSEKNIDDAIAWAKSANQPFKEELLNDLKREGTTLASELNEALMGTALPAGIIGSSPAAAKVDKVSFYTNGDFTDLCRGPHVESTGKVGAFKLMRVAGAYWRGNEKNPQMQRLYGIAFESEADLQNYLEMLEEAKKRDHRKLGKELDLFTLSPLVGSGLPLFTGRGTILRDLLNNYSQQLRRNVGYESVWTPHIAKKELYETSGHWAKFGDEWLTVKSKESNDELVMKPMNCPHHQQIYASRPRSYRDLPLRYMETTTDYRDEKAGELIGLARVRSLTQDDSHTFCTPDQIKEVMSAFVLMVKEFYEELNLPLKVRLSFKDDSDSYLGEADLWENAQAIIKDVVEEAGLEYYVGVGEAAFYGPKIDFMAQDALGRELQLATPQLDFVQPARFNLTYTDQDGAEKTPVMIHFAMLGSIERFLAAYIEHTAGWFPFWLAPEQVRILTINDSVADYVDQIKKELDDAILMKPVKYNEVRYSVDDRNESLGKKIKEATEMKIPVQLIVGPKDKDAGEVSVRLQSGEQKVKLTDLKDFLMGL